MSVKYVCPLNNFHIALTCIYIYIYVTLASLPALLHRQTHLIRTHTLTSTVTFILHRHMTQQMIDYNTDNKMNT